MPDRDADQQRSSELLGGDAAGSLLDSVARMALFLGPADEEDEEGRGSRAVSW